VIKMKKIFFSIILLIVSSLAFADEFGFKTECSDDPVKSKSISCVLRYDGLVSIKSVTASSNSKEISGVVWSPYDAAKLETAVLFLVDTSNPKRKRTVKANAKLIADFTNSAPDDFVIGVLGFDSELNAYISPTKEKTAIIEALKTLKAGGLTTELYLNVIKAIPTLAEVKAGRHYIVLMSDGMAEDKAYSLSDVVNAAKKDNIVIHGIGYPFSTNTSTALQRLKRLSEDTGGNYYKTDKNKVPEKFVDDFYKALRSGGNLELDLSGLYGKQDVQILVELENGEKVTQTVDINLPAKAKPPVVKVKIKESELQIFWKKYKYPLLGFVLIFLLALLWQIRKMSKDPEPGELLAYLKLLNANSTMYEIRNSSVRLGRNEQCEIQLMNDTVSGHHAEISMARDRSFKITDLGSSNGVQVNGEFIASQVLSDGDEIKLGEVALKFLALESVRE